MLAARPIAVHRCKAWDGIRKSVDETSYTIRFTSRQPSSTGSAVNARRMAELIAAGRVRPQEREVQAETHALVRYLRRLQRR